jgi:hypothetical protein
MLAISAYFVEKLSKSDQYPALLGMIPTGEDEHTCLLRVLGIKEKLKLEKRFFGVVFGVKGERLEMS